jgi:hypothetical protein
MEARASRLNPHTDHGPPVQKRGARTASEGAGDARQRRRELNENFQSIQKKVE